MIVLGGMGSITGAIFGAIVITILPEGLRQLPTIQLFGKTIIFADLRLVIYSALLVIIMLTRPQGLLGHHEFGLHWLRRSQKAPEGDKQVGDDKGTPITQDSESVVQNEAGRDAADKGGEGK